LSRKASTAIDSDESATETAQSLVPLSFKVTKSFKKRYQQAALDADMKLNELLSAMLDQWEDKHSVNKAKKP
jgi:membrane-anchored protein YejM (alkaline phosphatase superfamily)